MKPQDLQTLARAALMPAMTPTPTATTHETTMLETNHAEEQAAAQYSSIVDMVHAINTDFDRLDELKEEREELAEAVTDTSENAANNPAAAMDAAFELAEWDKNNAEELAQLLEDANGNSDKEEALDAIQQDPLEVQVRSDWTNPGETMEANEFMILLCTGGPAVRIVGELNEHGEPCRAWMEYQDWGTPWTEYSGATSSTLCRYASHFFGG